MINITRLIAAALTFGLFSWALWGAGRIGYSRTLAARAGQTSQLALADQAVQLSPSDPEAHYARADLLKSTGRQAEAVKELERAAALRPRYYFLQLKLGHARDRLGDREGALASYKESVRLAPYYALPRWYLGHFLLRAGQTDEAFAQLRRAADSDPSLLTDMIGLAGATFSGDARAIRRAVRPKSPAACLALAHYFVGQGNTTEAMTLFRAAGPLSAQERRDFLTELLKFKQFPEAYDVWSREHGAAGPGSIINGSFEGSIALDDPGFGWQIAPNAGAVRIYSDPLDPRDGSRSLRFDFNGPGGQSTRLLSQIVLVQPNTKYRLSFAARSQELATLGPPSVAVVDEKDGESRLAQPVLLQTGTGEWSDHALQFTTSGSTNAVLISIQREGCAGSGCPIYGHLWLDNFALQKL